jgi:hypothetical protein
LVDKSGRNSTISKVNGADRQLELTGNDDDWPGVPSSIEVPGADGILGLENKRQQSATATHISI